MRVYTRKTERGTNLSIIEEAAREVGSGMSVRAAGKKYGVDRMTLTRYVAKGGGSGYQGTAAAHKVFDADMEQELADHVKTLANQFHGLTTEKCCQLAFEFVEKNNMKMPGSWTRDRKVGVQWFKAFKKKAQS